jgi:hypothetical protein
VNNHFLHKKFLKKESSFLKNDKSGVDIEGEILGVKVNYSNPYSQDNIGLILCIRDDDRFIEKDFKVSAGWIDDLIETLQNTKKYLDDNFQRDEDELYKEIQDELNEEIKK